MANAELRIGVIGAGRWANMAHLPGWKRDPRCELVAVCDVSQDAADEAGRKYGIPTGTGFGSASRITRILLTCIRHRVRDNCGRSCRPFLVRMYRRP